MTEVASLDPRSPEFTQQDRGHLPDRRQGDGAVGRLLLPHARPLVDLGRRREAARVTARRSAVATHPRRPPRDRRGPHTEPGRPRRRPQDPRLHPGRQQAGQVLPEVRVGADPARQDHQVADGGQDELLKDNASLAGEKVQLWETMQALSEYAVFAKALDAATRRQDRRDPAPPGRIEEAQKLEADVLFPIRQRHQDILTQLAVSVQGYLAMDLIRKNNLELIKGVDRARTTTIAALRTAVIVAQALANQKMVLDQIDAINTTTNNMILKTSEMLKDQTTRIHQQASSSRGQRRDAAAGVRQRLRRPWTRSTPSGRRRPRTWRAPSRPSRRASRRRGRTSSAAARARQRELGQPRSADRAHGRRSTKRAVVGGIGRLLGTPCGPAAGRRWSTTPRRRGRDRGRAAPRAELDELRATRSALRRRDLPPVVLVAARASSTTCCASSSRRPPTGARRPSSGTSSTRWSRDYLPTPAALLPRPARQRPRRRLGRSTVVLARQLELLEETVRDLLNQIRIGRDRRALDARPVPRRQVRRARRRCSYWVRT